MDWKTYAFAMLLFTLVGLITLYGLQRLQAILPLNPQNLGAVAPDLSFNTSVSFNSNTNWQSYGGETTMSYLTQMIGLAVHNFLSAAIGMAVLIALIRGFVRHSAQDHRQRLGRYDPQYSVYFNTVIFDSGDSFGFPGCRANLQRFSKSINYCNQLRMLTDRPSLNR